MDIFLEPHNVDNPLVTLLFVWMLGQSRKSTATYVHFKKLMFVLTLP